MNDVSASVRDCVNAHKKKDIEIVDDVNLHDADLNDIDLLEIVLEIEQKIAPNAKISKITYEDIQNAKTVKDLIDLFTRYN